MKLQATDCKFILLIKKQLPGSLFKYRLLVCIVAGTVLLSFFSISGQKDISTVENDLVRMVFVTKPVPYLKEVVQKSSGRNFLAGPADKNFFTMEAVRSDGNKMIIESKDAIKGTFRITGTKKTRNIEIHYFGLGPLKDMVVKIKGEMKDKDPLVYWSLSLENPGKLKIVTLQFPRVAAVSAIGSPDDDFMVVPSFPGAMIENPVKNWKEEYSAAWAFPGQQSAQFLSYQDRSGGLYLASMDTLGYGRALRITRKGDNRFLLSLE